MRQYLDGGKMNLIELLLLCILIMQIVTFHSTADKFGRYAKLFDTFVHRPTKYFESKIGRFCKAALSKGKTKGN